MSSDFTILHLTLESLILLLSRKKISSDFLLGANHNQEIEYNYILHNLIHYQNGIRIHLNISISSTLMLIFSTGG
jgi:hypothetical protein